MEEEQQLITSECRIHRTESMINAALLSWFDRRAAFDEHEMMKDPHRRN